MIKTLLPTFSPCMRTGIIVWGAVAVLMALLLWVSSHSRNDPPPTAMSAQGPDAAVHEARSVADAGR